MESIETGEPCSVALQYLQGLKSNMPRRLARKLMLSITVIVIIVAAVSGLVNVKTEE